MSEPSEIAIGIERKAIELGFSACGFAAVKPLDELRGPFSHWLASGRAGEMGYLARNTAIRLDPRVLLDGAKTIISLAAAYYFPIPPHIPGKPRISRYAMGQDYHRILKSLGNELLCWIGQKYGPVKGRVFTDSAPIFEREWARQAGIGWIGKNGCLIIPKAGSWFFLAEIITDLEIPVESHLVPDRCGNCTRCIEACPTQALAGDGSIDPRRCISYLTIEHGSEIPEEFRGKWNDWVFGCDICQDVCPWNRDPAVSPIAELEPEPALATLGNEFFSDGDPEACKWIIGGTPLERKGWLGIVRNYVYLIKDIPH